MPYALLSTLCSLLHSTLLYSAVQHFSTLLYYAILYSTLLYPTLLYKIIPYHTIACHAIPRPTMPYHSHTGQRTTLFHTMLHLKKRPSLAHCFRATTDRGRPAGRCKTTGLREEVGLQRGPGFPRTTGIL